MSEMIPETRPVFCPVCEQLVVEIAEGTAATCICMCGELLSVRWTEEDA